MKTNDAPDKIYLATTEEVQNLDTSFVGIAHSDPQGIVNPVEYVRKDAFIEKGTEWIRKNWREYINVDKDGVVCFGHWEKDFKKYMKGD